MAIQFPSDAAGNTPYTDPSTGYIYDWDGQKWNARVPVGSGSGIAGITIQDEGVSSNQDATTLNFVGAGVDVTGDGDNTKVITIPGGGGGGGTVPSLNQVTAVGNMSDRPIEVGDYDPDTPDPGGAVWLNLYDKRGIVAVQAAAGNDTMSAFHVHNHNNGVYDVRYDGSVSAARGLINLNADGSASFAGDVGIGTDNPTRQLVLNNSAQCDILIKSGTGNYAQLLFGDTDAELRGAVSYNHNSDNMELYTAGSKKVNLDSSGNVKIGGTLDSSPNITLNANGSASFAGDVEIGDFSSTEGNYLFGSGGIYCKTSGTNQELLRLYEDSTINTRLFSDGSAEFAERVEVGSNGYSSPGVGIRSSGVIYVRPQTASTWGMQVYSGGETLSDVQFGVRGDGRTLIGPNDDPVISLLEDGSADFASGNTKIYASGHLAVETVATNQSTAIISATSENGEQFRVNVSGLATFAGTLSADSGKFRADNGLVHFNYPGYIAGTGENAYIDSDGGYISLASAAQITNGDAVFQIGSAADSNDIKARINADGSANFVGSFRAGPVQNYSLDTCEHIRYENARFEIGVPKDSTADAFRVMPGLAGGSATPTAKITGDGSALFKGTVSSLSDNGASALEGLGYNNTPYGLFSSPNTSSEDANFVVLKTGDVQIGNGGVTNGVWTDPKIKLNANGSGSFTSDLTSAGSGVLGLNASINGANPKALRYTAAGTLRMYDAAAVAGSETIELFSDGSAEFVATVQAGSNTLNGTAFVGLNSRLDRSTFVAANNTPGGKVFEGRNKDYNGSTVINTSWIRENGNAFFAGTVLAGTNTSPTDGAAVGIALQDYGAIHVCRSGDNDGIIAGYKEGTTLPTFIVTADGSASFGTPNSDSDETLKIGTPGGYLRLGNSTEDYAQIKAVCGSTAKRLVFATEGGTSGGGGFEFRTDASTTSISLHGDATFAGDVIISNASTGNSGVGIYKEGGINIYTDVDDPSAVATFQIVDKDGDVNLSITGDGSATFAGTINGTTVGTSDEKFKENITPASSQLSDVVALGGMLKNFDWNDDAPVNDSIRATRHLGLVAQQVEAVCPSLVKTLGSEDDTHKGISHDALIMKLLGAVKELDALRPTHVSFDGSGGDDFDFSTAKIASHNVASVERTAKGMFTITFTTPFASDKYTAVATAGDENHTGTGASPRCVNVVARTANSLDIVVERSDDAVQDDDGYISVFIAQ